FLSARFADDARRCESGGSSEVARGVLLEEAREQVIQRRVLVLKLQRRSEEGFGRHGEELVETLGAVRVEERLATRIEHANEAVECRLHHQEPVLLRLAVRQGWHAVG